MNVFNKIKKLILGSDINILNDRKRNVIIRKDNAEVIFVDGEDYIPKIMEYDESSIFKVYSLEDYRKALRDGFTEFDFSELNMEGEDIQNINLENCGLDINIREVFVPFGGSTKVGIYSLSPIVNYGDVFLRLSKSNLRGNKVYGDLSYFQEDNQKVYIWYGEDTFDEEYKAEYCQFFLDDDAPHELKKMYYNPKLVDGIDFISGEKIIYYEKNELTFDDYLKYFEWLDGKYIGNFSISNIDYGKIRMIREFGIDKASEMFDNLSRSCIPLDISFELISKMDDEEFSKVGIDTNIEDREKINLKKY